MDDLFNYKRRMFRENNYAIRNKNADMVWNPNRAKIPSVSTHENIKCGNCGEIFNYTSSMRRDTDDFDEAVSLLKCDSNSFYDGYHHTICPKCNNVLSFAGSKMAYYSSYTIWDNGDKIKLQWTSTSKGITDRLGKIQTYGTTYRQAIVLNTKSKQAYLLPQVNLDTKKKKGGIKNISYWNKDLHIGDISALAIKEFGELLREKIGFKWEFSNIKDLCIINRYRDASDQDMAFIDRFLGFVPLEVKRIIGDKEFVIKSGFHRASKPVKRILVQNAELMYMHVYTSKFIKEPDNQLKIYYNLLELLGKSDDNISDLCKRSLIYDKALNNIAEFVALFENETIGVNKVLRAFRRDPYIVMHLQDSLMMARKIKKAEVDFTHCLRGDLGEIHDRLSLEYSKIGKENIEIHHTKAELNKEIKIGEYSFALARNTDELRHIGSVMDICVGTYDDKAVNKECTIYYVIKNNRLVSCIELRSGALFQAKAYCNFRLAPDPAGAVWQWVNHFKIPLRNLWDLQPIENCPEINRPISKDVERLIPEEVLAYVPKTETRRFVENRQYLPF